MKTNTQNLISKLQISALVLMTAALGWTGGNFTPQDSPAWNYLLHCIPIVLLLVFSLFMFRMRDDQQGATSIRRTRIAVSVFVTLSIIGTIVMIVLGANNPDPNAVGIKTFADWVPVVILNMGNLLWLGTLVFARRPHAAAVETVVGA